MLDTESMAVIFCLEYLGALGQGNEMHILVRRMNRTGKKEEAVRSCRPKVFFTQKFWRNLGPGQGLRPSTVQIAPGCWNS